MLRELTIQHFIIVPYIHCQLPNSFSVITGESGSGKSIVLLAIEVLLGKRFDPSYIMPGKEFARLEAVFHAGSSMKKKLSDMEIPYEEECMVVVREVTRKGRSRAFINDHLVTQKELNQIFQKEILFLNHENCQELLDHSFQNTLYQGFSQTEELYQEWQETQKKCQELVVQRESYAAKLPLRDAAIEVLEKEIEEVGECCQLLKQENKLFQRYQEVIEKEFLKKEVEALGIFFHQEDKGLIHRHRQLKKQLTPFLQHPALGALIPRLESALQEIEEFSFMVGKLESIENNEEEEAAKIETILHKIDRMKKKYGLHDLHQAQRSLEGKKQLYEDWVTLPQKEEAIFLAWQKYEAIEKQQRQKLEESMQSYQPLFVEGVRGWMEHFHLQGFFDLSFSKERLQVHFSYHNQHKGYDLAASITASSGELARLLLACTMMAHQSQNLKLFIIDEVDANIGGITALRIGEALQHLGKKLQVIAITHFPQMAEQALHHFKVTKEFKQGHGITNLISLCKELRQEELLRMRGCVG